jgi:hypothetical protein
VGYRVYAIGQDGYEEAFRWTAVTIAPTDSNAREPGANTGKFTVTRSGCTNRPLTVNYTVGGTATPGSDYKLLSGKVAITAGRSLGIITAKALDDAISEPGKTVILTISASATYAVGSSSNATANIRSNE